MYRFKIFFCYGPQLPMARMMAAFWRDEHVKKGTNIHCRNYVGLTPKRLLESRIGATFFDKLGDY